MGTQLKEFLAHPFGRALKELVFRDVDRKEEYQGKQRATIYLRYLQNTKYKTRKGT